MELTDNEIHLLARLSRHRRLYAECKGADLDALQQLGSLQWFDARSSTTPFKEDPRPLFKLLGINGSACRPGCPMSEMGRGNPVLRYFRSARLGRPPHAIYRSGSLVVMLAFGLYNRGQG
jgi:hypothetical protein